jgi:glycosyltransferase involved in cell wall biosynthesis
MKIVLATHFPSDITKPHGGVEAVTANLAQGLSELEGVDIEVVTLDKSINSVKTNEWGNIKIHRIPRKVSNELLNSVTAGRSDVKRFIQELKPDIVHAHDTYGIMIKGIKIPRVFTVHGFIHSDTRLTKRNLSLVRSMLWRYIELGAWADQPYIISISPYVRERISQVSKGVIFDIDNPISSGFFNIERNEQNNRIFSAAHINPRKNPLKLIEAINLLKNQGYDLELRLAGKVTDNAYGEKVKRYIDENELMGCVKLLGVLDMEAIKSELAKASIFSLVSHEENSPMGIEEAMAVGMPMVTSNKCGMPYMVHHRESGFLVNENDERDIAKKIKYILDDQSLRESMGVKAKETATSRFHIDVVAKRTFEAYKEILEK